MIPYSVRGSARGWWRELGYIVSRRPRRGTHAGRHNHVVPFVAPREVARGVTQADMSLHNLANYEVLEA